MNTNFWQEHKLSYTKLTQLKLSNLFEQKIRVADYLHLMLFSRSTIRAISLMVLVDLVTAENYLG